MKVEDLEDWTLTLDREIAGLREKLTGDDLDTTMAVLDTSFSELHAASSEIRAQQNQIERARQESSRTRQRHEMLLELVTDAVLETDEVGAIREANQVSGRLLGVRPDSLVDQPLSLLVAAADRAVISDALRAIDRLAQILNECRRACSGEGAYP